MKKYTNEFAIKLATASGFKPIQVYPGAKTSWLCIHLACGNKVKIKLNSIAGSKTETCKYCSRFAKITEESAIKIMNEAGLKPSTSYPGYDKPWAAIHTACGSKVTTRLHAVKSGGGGCKKCGWKQSASKRITPSEIAIEEMTGAGLKPLEPFTGVRKPWKSRCLTCNKIVSPHLGSIRAGRGGCKYCAGNVLLTNQQAVAIMVSNNLQPLEQYVNALTAWKAKCLKCGHIVSPKLGAISGGQGPCIYCAGKKMDPYQARRIMLASNLKPQEPFKSVRKPWKSLCMTCGNKVTPRLASVLKNGRACSFCSNTGFDTSKAGYLYFLVHPDWAMYQIGITNDPDTRLRQHERLGWTTKELRGPMDGLITQKLERDILKVLKLNGADLKNSKVVGKFDGYSESWSKSTFPAKSIRELIRLTDLFEEGKSVANLLHRKTKKD
jgi:hypothetical protein